MNDFKASSSMFNRHSRVNHDTSLQAHRAPSAVKHGNLAANKSFTALGEGDWNGAPGGRPGNPPAGDGLFNQRAVVAALAPGHYLTGPYGSLSPNGVAADERTSIGYDASTGAVWVDAPAGSELTSINVDSAAGIFIGDPARNLGGSFDNHENTNIFKATFGSSFASLRFGDVARTGLSEGFLLHDITVIGSLADGGGLEDVDLIYVPVPEPSTFVLLALGLLAVLTDGARAAIRSCTVVQ